MNVVYVGGNDGLLHGFRTGSYDANGNFVATGNDGLEVLAYMPGAVVQTIHSTTANVDRSEEHTSELQSQSNLVCRLLLEKKKQRPRLRPLERPPRPSVRPRPRPSC